MNKRGELILILIVTLFLIPLTFAFSGVGDGTAGNPYNITNCTQLQEMNASLASNYQLVNNIDCSDTINWGTVGFKPIGINSSINFSGNFSGNNYNVSNLYINNSSLNYAGLFGYVTGEIKNIRLINGNVTGNESVGILVGDFEGKNISNCSSSGSVIGGGNNVGGLVGYFLGENIINSSSTSKVTGGKDYVGGLVGYFEQGSIDILNSYATGEVRGLGGRYIGGLAGDFWGENIISSYATGNVTGGGDDVGGLVGYVDTGNITDSYATGNVTGGGNEIGGLVGYFTGGDSITDSYATGTIDTTGGSVGGLAGYFDSKNIADSYATGDVTGEGENVGGLSGYFKGNVISNSSAIGNVISEGVYSYTGGLVGYFYLGNITDSYTTGDVTGGKDYVGGLVGIFNAGLLLSNSYATGDVIGEGNSVGGLVGQLDGNTTEGTNENLLESYATGDVTGGKDYVGGLVGYFSGDTINSSLLSSYSTGNVNATGDYAGGLVGYFYGTLNNSYATGNATGGGTQGGIGGLVGLFSGRFLSSSYSTGNVNGAVNMGGFVGIITAETTIIEKSYSTGSIMNESATVIGGFAGLLSGGVIRNVYWYNQSTNLNCYNGGNQNCTAISENSYFYNYENSPMNLSLGTGWNFTTWDDVYNGTDYPVLIWQDAIILDTTAPTYSYATENLNTTLAGQAVLFSVLWDDETTLNDKGQYIFSTNNTGTWVNDTAINFTATPEWANITKTLNSTGGIFIGYKWYAKDNAGNWNSTGMNTLTTSELESEDEVEENSDIVYPSPKTYKLDEEDLEQENELELKGGDKITIPEEDENYTLRLDKFNSSEATLRVENITNGTSNHFIIVLPIDVPYELDLNSDSIPDTVLVYTGINQTSKKAMISVRNALIDPEVEVIPEKQTSQNGSPFKIDWKFLVLLLILFIISFIVFLIVTRKSKKRKKKH